MQLWCGIDWAKNHHDVSIVEEGGTQRVRLRIDDTVAGFTQLMTMLAEQQSLCSEPITAAIETSKGLLPVALRAAGVPVVAINPLAVSRYRDRHSPSRSKSDAGDAYVLANILRTDPHSHRSLPVDSVLAQSIHVLARAHQDAVWDRMQIANKLRSVLREYYPRLSCCLRRPGQPRGPRDLAPRALTDARATAAQIQPDRGIAPHGANPRHSRHRQHHPRSFARRTATPADARGIGHG